MNITVNITEPIKRVQEFQEYDLGQITTTLQDLLDNSSIIVNSNIIPILKVSTIDNIVKNYLIKDLTENIYNTGEYITGQDLTEEDLLLITGENQEIGINTGFIEKTYNPIMSVIYDSINPNFDIHLTGNLDLTITETVNGDSGMINLYFSSTEVATLNGFANLVVIGAGEMIPVYFIHDSDGLKWYNDNVIGIDLTVLDKKYVNQDAVIRYHKHIGNNTGTFSNTGTSCIGTGTTIIEDYSHRVVGAKIKKANGEVGIITAVADETHFTVVGFDTNSIDTTFELHYLESRVNLDGSVEHFNATNGFPYAKLNTDNSFTIFDTTFGTNGNVNCNGTQFSIAGGAIRLNNNGTLVTHPSTYASDAAAAADGGLESGSEYLITGSTVKHIKP